MTYTHDIVTNTERPAADAPRASLIEAYLVSIDAPKPASFSQIYGDAKMADYYLTADTSGSTPPAPYETYTVVNPNGIGNFTINVDSNSNVAVAGDVDGNVNIDSVSGTDNYNVTTTVLADTTGASAGSSTIFVNGGSENDIVSTISVVGRADKFNVNVGDGPANAKSTLTVGIDGKINNYTGSSDGDDITILGTARDILTSGGADVVSVGPGAVVRNIDTGSGTDAVTVNGTSGTVDTGDNADTVLITGQTGNVATRGGADNVTVAAGGSAGNVDSGNSADIISIAGTAGNIDSGDNDDQLSVSGTVGIINTRSGSDTLTITDATVNGLVNTGSGGDVLSVSDSTLTGDIRTEGGADTITLANGSAVSGFIAADIPGIPSNDADDVVSVDGSTVGEYIATYGGDDSVSLNNATVDGILNTEAGSDTVNLSGTLTMGESIFGNSISTGSGSDVVNLESSATLVMTGQINLQGNPTDTVNITPVTPEAKADLVEADFELNNNTGIYENTGDDSFTYKNVVFENVENSNTGKVCFARGTQIETNRGAVAIEDLTVGDLVQTRDNGLQAIRWINSNAVSSQELEENPNFRPIRIRRHALGTNTPSSDLVVSPQHRVLVRSKIAHKMFGADEVLVAAKHLRVIEGIAVADDIASIEYFHMLFDGHEVIMSNGAETESLFAGPEALKSIGKKAYEEIFALFPELKDRDYTPTAARELAKGRMGRKLAVRHKENRKALVSYS